MPPAAVLIVAAAVATLMAFVQADSDRSAKPTFSWDTLPLFYHCSNATGPYTEDALRVLARANIVTFEKYLNRGMPSAEDATAQAARDLKRINASVTTILYLNEFLDYPWYNLARRVNTEPSWWLRDTRGRVLNLSVIDIRCEAPGNGPPCGLSLPPGVPCCMRSVPAWDFAVPAMREAFVNACVGALDNDLDGCFLDAGGKSPPWGCPFPAPTQQDPERCAEWSEGKNNASMEIARRLGERGGIAVANGALGNYSYGGADVGPQAVFIEYFEGTEEAMHTLQLLGTQRRIVEARGMALCNATSRATEGVRQLATFLLGAGERAYFGCSGSWETYESLPSPVWFDEYYGRPLGAPLGPAVLRGNKTFSRHFASGAYAEVDFITGRVEVMWGDGTSHHVPERL